MARTIVQRYNLDGIAKAGEMIEVRQSSALTLHDRRVLNLLIRYAGERIADECEHVIPMRDLRSSHKGGERVRDSIERLMTTLVLVPAKDSKGRTATRRTTLLSDTTTTDDEDNPQGEVRYSFSPTMREILRRSEYWGRIKPHVMFAFSTKYALALYEALCLRRNLTRTEETFSVENFREILSVVPNKLTSYKNLNSWAISPAVEKINALSDFNVEVMPMRQGSQKRGTVTSFRVRWEVKESEEWEQVLAELMRTKVGRKARVRGTVERVPDALSIQQAIRII